MTVICAVLAHTMVVCDVHISDHPDSRDQSDLLESRGKKEIQEYNCTHSRGKALPLCLKYLIPNQFISHPSKLHMIAN